MTHSKDFIWNIKEGEFSAVEGDWANVMDAEYPETTTTLPDWQFNKDRKYMANGHVLNTPSSVEHDDGVFPMVVQTDYWMSGSCQQFENMGSVPQLYSSYWSDGVSGHAIESGYIKEYKIEGTSDGFPKQTLTMGFQKGSQTGAAILNPNRNVTEPVYSLDSVDLQVDSTSVDDVSRWDLTLNMGVNDDKNAVSWDRQTPMNNKKELTLNITQKDNRDYLYEKNKSGLAYHDIKVDIDGLGDIDVANLIVNQVEKNTIDSDPAVYEYDVKFINASGTTAEYTEEV